MYFYSLTSFLILALSFFLSFSESSVLSFRYFYVFVTVCSLSIVYLFYIVYFLPSLSSVFLFVLFRFVVSFILPYFSPSLLLSVLLYYIIMRHKEISRQTARDNIQSPKRNNERKSFDCVKNIPTNESGLSYSPHCLLVCISSRN